MNVALEHVVDAGTLAAVGIAEQKDERHHRHLVVLRLEGPEGLLVDLHQDFGVQLLALRSLLRLVKDSVFDSSGGSTMASKLLVQHSVRCGTQCSHNRECRSEATNHVCVFGNEKWK